MTKSYTRFAHNLFSYIVIYCFELIPMILYQDIFYMMALRFC